MTSIEHDTDASLARCWPDGTTGTGRPSRRPWVCGVGRADQFGEHTCPERAFGRGLEPAWGQGPGGCYPTSSSLRNPALKLIKDINARRAGRAPGAPACLIGRLADLGEGLACALNPRLPGRFPVTPGGQAEMPGKVSGGCPGRCALRGRCTSRSASTTTTSGSLSASRWPATPSMSSAGPPGGRPAVPPRAARPAAPPRPARPAAGASSPRGSAWRPQRDPDPCTAV